MRNIFFIALSIVLISFSFRTASANYLNENKKFELKNQVTFFKQNIRGEFSLPKTLSPRQDLLVSFQIPNEIKDPTLKKVFTTDLTFQESTFLLTAKLEVYYFFQNGEKYLSQQVTFLKEKTILSRCTSYFPESQNFLVPGACSGSEMGILWGISIYK